MSVYPECTWLLFVCLCHLLVSAGGTSLRSCEPFNVKISVAKDGCPKCLEIQTSICGGHCETKDLTYWGATAKPIQKVCTYDDKQVRYETVRLPDCLPGVDPRVTYPVPLSCVCKQCDTETSDCTAPSPSHRLDLCMSHESA